MTSAQIRQSFLDFFREKKHTIVPSSSLMPDSPNLLFTNAGMNQFVPFFLGQKSPDVSKWAGVMPASDTRAADTQKCIRAGGKHNDLDDVGLDTYHHTFFEMLGNWSFGDYFKKEAIEWAWELVVLRWKFPAERLYATIYNPEPGDPASRDEEAWSIWAEKFRSVGLDPAIHIVNGNKKDNFWMMGDTGPCGPCSELHIDLTPKGDTGGALVNKGSAQCIEIWNLVFIQFNANPDGTFSPLPARHVDTGMGFERVTSIIQGTKGLTDFANARISNYETDIFRPIFDELEKLTGKSYGATLPEPGAQLATLPVQFSDDIAFRVIADHIRTLSFAIADGIQPGNTDRNYVLRRILRRAVRYGRTIGLREPFFYKLVDVLSRTMGDVFPEIRQRQKHVEEVLRREEEAFNRTLDKGIALFNEEAARISTVPGTAPASGASAGAPAGVHYIKRHLPHFERPWAKYMVSFSTRKKRHLTPAERDIVLESIRYAHDHGHYELYAACVMPDHVHLLFEPQIKSETPGGEPVFHSLLDILQAIKSSTAHRINKAANVTGIHVWEEESYDRLIRGEADLQEKFGYICRNPWDAKLQLPDGSYPWLWTAESDEVSREGAENSARGGRAPRDHSPSHAPKLSGAFAFRLYDEQGFPLDLTELMARERGLSVDTSGFELLMEEQRTRARAAQKKTVIALSEIETKTPTCFEGYDQLSTSARVLEVVSIKDKTAVVLDASTCYAEMGGQVGDTAELISKGQLWNIANTQKIGNTWLHFLDSTDAPAVQSEATITVHRARRTAIERHHTVTHLLHWALHEVVSPDASQKGSFVSAEKLTFDFNSAPLSAAQIREMERLVNERILENQPVYWKEVPYADVRGRADIMQFFGDKYGDSVRVVQIGGEPGAFNGYSMELCAGTHVRSTGEIGLFRILGESAIAAGVRRIEAVAGLEAASVAVNDAHRLQDIATSINCPVFEIEKKIEALLALQKELEKSLKSARAREAAARAKEIAGQSATIAGIPFLAADLGAVDGDYLQAVADAFKGSFSGVVVLAGSANQSVALVATVSSDFTAKIQAGKIIQTIAPLVGGKGGGKPDSARGGGKDVTQIHAALEKARSLIA